MFTYSVGIHRVPHLLPQTAVPEVYQRMAEDGVKLPVPAALSWGLVVAGAKDQPGPGVKPDIVVPGLIIIIEDGVGVIGRGRGGAGRRVAGKSESREGRHGSSGGRGAKGRMA